MDKNTEKVQKLEETTSELAITDEKLTIMMEAKAMDKQIRIRGLPEQKGEDIYLKNGGNTI